MACVYGFTLGTYHPLSLLHSLLYTRKFQVKLRSIIAQSDLKDIRNLAFRCGDGPHYSIIVKSALPSPQAVQIDIDEVVGTKMARCCTLPHVVSSGLGSALTKYARMHNNKLDQ